MRFFLVISIWIVIVGGLWSYISQRDFHRSQYVAASPIDLRVTGDFSIEITPTFSTEKDPFALVTAETPDTNFQFKLNGTLLDTDKVDLHRGQSLQFNKVGGVLEGHNEIYVEASPPVTEDQIEHGLRIKLYQEQTLILDKTVWSSLGTQVSATVSFNHDQNKRDAHDH